MLVYNVHLINNWEGVYDEVEWLYLLHFSQVLSMSEKPEPCDVSRAMRLMFHHKLGRVLVQMCHGFHS